MRLRKIHTFYTLSACLLLLLNAIARQADDTDLLNKKVTLAKSKGTVYELLQQVAKQSGYLFIYDSSIVNNDRVVRISKGEYNILTAIRTITGNHKLEAKLINNHILLYLPEAPLPANVTVPEEKHPLVVKGRVYDAITQEPIPSVLVSLNKTNTSIITNHNGDFRLTIADSLNNPTIKLSHMGYENQELSALALSGLDIKLYLIPRFIPLQEVVVRKTNPITILQKMLQNRTQNYSPSPSIATTFYREIIEHKNSKTNATEAVLSIYRTGYQQEPHSDQVKLIKMRNVLNSHKKDSILVKIKASIETCLTLDLTKNLPDFLMPDEVDNSYTYRHTDMVNIDGKDVHVISFQQKDYISQPLFQGQLFITTDSYALIGATFEVNPKFVEKATSDYLIRVPKNQKFTLQHASYIVSYKLAENGSYYLNHVSGDVQFKLKRKKAFFSSPLRVFFEMVVTDIETENVKRFSKHERLQVGKIFSDTKYSYDADFWGSFNIIMPEDKLKEFLMKNPNSISEIPDDE